MATEYDKLVSELDDILAKAQPVEDGDDEKIAAAAGEDENDKNDGDHDEDDILKSFAVTLENGETVEAYDATALLKAMHSQARRQGETIAQLETRLAGADAVIQKVPTLLKAMQEQLATQADMLKALREQPGGRKAVTQASGATADKMSRGDVMAKALGAQRAGRLSMGDVAAIEARINNGLELAPHHLTALSG